GRARPAIWTPSLHDPLPILSKRIDHLEANARDEWPIYRDSVIRLLEMKREVNDIISTIHEELENLTPNIQVNSDRHLEDLQERLDRKSTRLNSSHVKISYAV